jgi:hypothetical protein
MSLTKKLKIDSVYTEVSRIQYLEEALEFYADPDNYFAVGFFIDRPADDFSDDHDGDYDRPMAGKLAREVLSVIKKINLEHYNKNEENFIKNNNVAKYKRKEIEKITTRLIKEMIQQIKKEIIKKEVDDKELIINKKQLEEEFNE